MRFYFLPFIFGIFCSCAHATEMKQIQKYLGQLGYSVGVVDGVYGKRTGAALEKFYQSFGGKFDGVADKNELADLLKFIKENNIKPKIPTSTEIAKNGSVPRRPLGKWWTLSRVFFDINGDGIKDYFEANMNYKTSQTPKTATLSDFKIFIGNGSGYRHDTNLLSGNKKGCIHPRKALVSDFNLDGRPDIFVVCHGWDKTPFPGEKNKIVLSQNDNRYEIFDANSKVGFYHGGAAADFDGDGNPDVLVTNNKSNNPVQVWLGDGNGNFKVSTKTVPFSLRSRGNYFTASLPDIDGDGRFDLFVGGHDWEKAPTSIYLNTSKNGFKAGKKISIPKIKGQGVVLDVVATGQPGDRVVWVLRTSGGDGTFYKGACIQRFEIKSKKSEIAYCDKSKRWFPWLITWKKNGRTFVGSDNPKDGISILVD